jgi:hypothetical protein
MPAATPQSPPMAPNEMSSSPSSINIDWPSVTKPMKAKLRAMIVML